MSGLELSSISAAAIPADVRAAGTEAEETYKAALGFERMMLSQLTKSMFSSAEGEGEGDEEGQSAATGAYKEMLPGTLADAVTNAGGIGLAEDLYKTMRGIA
jgi:Rod binding domain-containing protein